MAVDVLKVIHVNDKRVIPRLDRGIHQKNIEKWIPAGVYPEKSGAGMTKQPVPGLTADQHALINSAN